MKLATAAFGAAVVLALLQCQGAFAQTQVMSDTLYMNWNYTTMTTGYASCSNSNPVVGVYPANSSDVTMLPVSAQDAGTVDVEAIWFGGSVGTASNFQITGNCSALQLTSNGGHGTTVYTGPVPLAPNGCVAEWYESAQYLHLFVNITNTGYAWSMSLPTVTSVRAQTSCNGGFQYCPLVTGITCDSVLDAATTLQPNGGPSPAALIANKGGRKAI